MEALGGGLFLMSEVPLYAGLMGGSVICNASPKAGVLQRAGMHRMQLPIGLRVGSKRLVQLL